MMSILRGRNTTLDGSKKTRLSVIALITLSLLPVLFANFEGSIVSYYYALLNFLIIFCVFTLKGMLRILLNFLIIASFAVAAISTEVSGGMLSNGALHSILATNTNEVLEYFSLINGWSFLFTILLTIVSMVIITKSTIPTKRQFSLPIYTLTLALCFGYPFFRYTVDEGFKKNAKDDLFSMLYVVPPMPTYNLYLTATLAFHERQLSQEQYGNALPSHIRKLPLSSENEGDIILILGESSRRGSYSIYDETINTTPNLKRRLEKSDQFQRISNVFSPAPNTRESVARSLTFATSSTYLHDGLPFKTLLSSMSDAGYETVWVTTQDLYTRWDTFSAKVANSADRVIHKSLDGLPWTDSNAANVALNVLKQPQKSFIVLHLWGEHSDYRIRNGIPIPQDSINAIKKQVTKEQLLDKNKIHYLASIHHTDTILESIFSHIDQSNQTDLAIYFPDHGEVIGKGHGLIPIRLESELSIPFVAQGHRSKLLSHEIEKFRDKRFGVFNTSYFPEVMINTLGGAASVPTESRNLTYFSIEGSPTRVRNDDYINRS